MYKRNRRSSKRGFILYIWRGLLAEKILSNPVAAKASDRIKSEWLKDTNYPFLSFGITCGRTWRNYIFFTNFIHMLWNKLQKYNFNNLS
jgi:hypothetical protein